MEQVTMPLFRQSVMSHTKPHDSKELAICDWTIGLGGEAGEIMEATNNFCMQQGLHEKMEIMKEVGDILWYTTMLAEEVGAPLPDNTLEMVYKNNSRRVSQCNNIPIPTQASFIVVQASKIQEKIKHHLMHKEPLNIPQLHNAMIDLFMDCDAFIRDNLREDMGVSINEVLLLNMRKLSHRFSGGAYSNSASADRHNRETKFKETEGYLEIERFVQGV